ncbi:MAG: PadR family transcriptional regulator [Candidatus Kerfeldbacteria bacterium]|nr:PadR family transcriptional regulator [Candidatus Kerfeldbacteria bacterium]
MNRELLKGHSELIILAALAQRPMHGYSLSEHIKSQVPETFKFGVGMIYPLLHRLEQKNLIRGVWQGPGGMRRRVYSLTARGKKALAAKRDEWQTFQSMMTNVAIPTR